MAAPLVSIRNLAVAFATPRGDVAAVDGFSLDLDRGETVAVVGESGSGKSQAMLAVLGLLAANGRASGSVRLDGTEILNLPAGDLTRIRGRRIGMVFQEPMTALDPLTRVGDLLAEVHREGEVLREEVCEGGMALTARLDDAASAKLRTWQVA